MDKKQINLFIYPYNFFSLLFLGYVNVSTPLSAAVVVVFTPFFSIVLTMDTNVLFSVAILLYTSLKSQVALGVLEVGEGGRRGGGVGKREDCGLLFVYKK